jgi:ceramide glucosyltransferase
MLVDILMSVIASAGTLALLWATLRVAVRVRGAPKCVILPDDLLVTVMKPLSGIDSDLEKNLTSFALLQAPPGFQVLLCLGSQTDPAFPLAQRFETAHPERFQVVVGLGPDFGNFKMAQLHAAMPFVKNDFIWMSDSNVVTDERFMNCLVGTWKAVNQTGRQKTLVHAPLCGVGGSGLGAALERLHLPSLQNPNHELALLVGLNAVVGKNLFFHKDDLQKVGGFAAFGNYLGEDHMMGLAFADGGQVVCSNEATRNSLGTMGLKAWWARHARWAVLRKTMVTGAFLVGEPFISLWLPMVLLLLGLIEWPLAALLFVSRIVIDITNLRLVSRERLRVTDCCLSPLKELFLMLLWVQALFTFHVQWREGKAIRLGAKSVVVSKTEQTSKFRRNAESLKRVLSSVLS